jgi:Ca-activated chloride channel homolog
VSKPSSAQPGAWLEVVMRVLTHVFALGLVAAAAAGVASIGVTREKGSQAKPLPSESAGVISGRVEDASGAALANVRVDLLRSEAVVQTTRTDARGLFRFEKVAADTYVVRASREGLRSVELRVALSTLPVPPLRLAMGIPDTAALLDSARKPLGAGGGRGASGSAGNAAGGVVGGLPAPPPPPAPAQMSAPARAAEAAMSRDALVGRMPVPQPRFNTAAYDKIDENGFRRVADDPLSTFSIDVDTASYANVRRFLNEGTLPPADAVRIEELVNYFRFPYRDGTADVPFSVTTEVAPCPWNPRHSLALVGLQARRDARHIPGRNLVFLLDVSGSMTPADRLPLVKTAMQMLVDTLTAEDSVAVVVYAGASGLALPPTPGDRKKEIREAIDRLTPGGSTNGAAGIQLAYDIAAKHSVKGGVNRVILATDGDFNVGVTSQGELIRLIEQERERGIFLSVLGVGNDNLKDSTMEKLADKGNGNYAYLDSLLEARRVLVEEANSTLLTVAKDVKIQIEFNPRTVGAYRLVGYENRMLNKEDFNDDRKDAGEIGAGHSVTALYELVPPGEPLPGGPVDPLVYQDPPKAAPSSSRANELMTVKLRYKKPDEDTSRLLTVVVDRRAGELTPNLGFASAVAEYGMLLRRSPNKGEATWTSAQTLARTYRGDDPGGYRAEFIRLLDLAAALDARSTTTPVPVGAIRR